MNEVPNWEWLLLVYIILVALPVMLVHSAMRKKLLHDKSILNFALYFVSIAATALLMHFICMWMYFKFMFSHNP